MSFTQLNLNSNICKALALCGYETPTPIQARSIPSILEGKDLIASAQTGTGKTAAFVLPALHRLTLEKASKKTRILILSPTRELATQITKAATTYGKFLQFNMVSLVGGMPYRQQIKDLSRGADLIVATPGRLLDHINQGKVDLSHISMLILDEADRMLDMGFIDDVARIVKLTPAKRQILLFSATVDAELEKVIRKKIMCDLSDEAYQKKLLRINLSQEKISISAIKQELYKVSNIQYKVRLLVHLINTRQIDKAIIFSATKINADRLAEQLCEHGFAAAAIHGDLKQNVRNRTLEKFRRGMLQFLVATDVVARGIDIHDVPYVFNFDLPRFAEDYVHRIGRTGRAGKSGIAISFVQASDTQHLKKIERYTKLKLALKSIAIKHDEPSLAIAMPEETPTRPKKKASQASGEAHRKPAFSKKQVAEKKQYRKSEQLSSSHPKKHYSEDQADVRKQARFSKKPKQTDRKHPIKHKRDRQVEPRAFAGQAPVKARGQVKKSQPYQSRGSYQTQKSERYSDESKIYQQQRSDKLPASVVNVSYRQKVAKKKVEHRQQGPAAFSATAPKKNRAQSRSSSYFKKK